MDWEREQQKALVADYFKDKAINAKLIEEFCQNRGIDPVFTPNEVEDILVQTDTDRITGELMPLIAGKLAEIQYYPDFVSKERTQEIKDNNDRVHVEVCQLLESRNIPVHLFDTVVDTIQQAFDTTLSQAKNALNNKLTQALLHIAREKFGEEVNIGVIAKYAEDVINKHHEEKAEATPVDEEEE